MMPSPLLKIPLRIHESHRPRHLEELDDSVEVAAALEEADLALRYLDYLDGRPPPSYRHISQGDAWWHYRGWSSPRWGR